MFICSCVFVDTSQLTGEEVLVAAMNSGVTHITNDPMGFIDSRMQSDDRSRSKFLLRNISEK